MGEQLAELTRLVPIYTRTRTRTRKRTRTRICTRVRTLMRTRNGQARQRHGRDAGGEAEAAANLQVGCTEGIPNLRALSPPTASP